MANDPELLARIRQRNSDGRAAEENGDLEGAAKLYEENIKSDHADPYAYERLMIIYRKLKKYKDELRVIDRGIKIFSDRQAKQVKEFLSARKNKKQVLELSNVFMAKSGLANKKGDSTYQPGPINKWKKRRVLVEKKIKGNKPKKKG